jgi:hypothetical protein
MKLYLCEKPSQARDLARNLRIILENYLAILAKEAIAISKPTGLLANDIKRKIKPCVTIP